MSDSEKDEKENEKPYPKNSKVKGEEEEDDFPNKENDINDNNFPEEENDIDNGQKQSINNNNNISNDENENENDFIISRTMGQRYSVRASSSSGVRAVFPLRMSPIFRWSIERQKYLYFSSILRARRDFPV